MATISLRKASSPVAPRPEYGPHEQSQRTPALGASLDQPSWSHCQTMAPRSRASQRAFAWACSPAKVPTCYCDPRRRYLTVTAASELVTVPVPWTLTRRCFQPFALTGIALVALAV
jgi:hypothetical protein